MKYSMEAAIEAERLEEQVFQSNYSLADELSRFKFSPNEIILDAGCGTGVLSRFLAEQRKVKKIHGIDFSDLRLKQAEKLSRGSTKDAVSFYRQDLGNLEAKFHGQYDTVICRYVLEHCDNPVKVLTELRKSLKPGGRLIGFDLDGVFLNLYSQNAKLNAYMEEFTKGVRFDLNVGRKMPAYLKQAGFTNIEWNAELLCCKGERLEEERTNTEKRFAAITSFLTELLGSKERFEEFKHLYLTEMMKPENTSVFTKFIFNGTNP